MLLGLFSVGLVVLFGQRSREVILLPEGQNRDNEKLLPTGQSGPQPGQYVGLHLKKLKLKLKKVSSCQTNTIKVKHPNSNSV